MSPSPQTWRDQFKWRVGDTNGFAQLFFDNLGTLLSLIFFLQQTLRGFNNSTLINEAANGAFQGELVRVSEYIDALIFERTIPGLAITMIFGNVYYSYMGARLGKDENRAGDVTALPYGINTPGAFAFLFAIIGPSALGAGIKCGDFLTGDFPNQVLTTQENAQNYAICWENAAEAGWQAGVVSNFLAGIISIGFGFAGKWVLKATPVVALLTGLAGVGFVFLGIVQISENFAEPLVGLVPLFLSWVLFFGDVSLGRFPKAGAIAIAGIALAWMDGVANAEMVDAATANVKFWGVSEGFTALGDWSSVGEYIGTTFPVALAAAAGTLMNTLSAENAGDKYGVSETMVSDGVGTVIASLFGAPFGTSVYIGHPSYKKGGAGVMYSLANCFVFFFLALFGLFALLAAIVPKVTVAPVILFVGITIVQEALAAAPTRQYPAVVIGLFPALTDWAVVGGMSFAGIGGNNYYGFVSMSKGALLLSLILTSILIFIIERDFLPAAGWTVVAALLSAVGLLHQDTAMVDNWESTQALYCKHPRIESSLDPAGICPANFAPCLQDGFLPKCAPESTIKWRFMTAYLMCAAMLVVFYFGQKKGWVAPTITEEEAQEIENKEGKSDTVKRMSQLAHPEHIADDVSETDVKLEATNDDADPV